MAYLKSYWIVLIALAISFSGLALAEYAGSDDTKDLLVTREEQRVLEKVKSQVLPYITEEFMRSDFFLIRFIRVANLDANEAKRLILQNVQWRQHNNISNILHEDLEDLVPDYHMSFYGGRDKQGRPFGTMELGEWDLRAAVLQGKTKRLDRYLTYALERAIHELLRAQKGMKKPITKILVLIDGEGGNAMQHLCAQCLAILLKWLQTMESYYPQFVKEIIMINAPPITEIGLRVLKPAMSKETQAALKIFDHNKKNWMKYLDDRIHRHQRTKRYGGTRPEEFPQHFYGAVYKNDFVIED